MGRNHTTKKKKHKRPTESYTGIRARGIQSSLMRVQQCDTGLHGTRRRTGGRPPQHRKKHGPDFPGTGGGGNKRDVKGRIGFKGKKWEGGDRVGIPSLHL